MHYFSLDHGVVYIFLLLTLVVGLWASRGIKDLREYAIANRVYGTGVLTITFLATLIGGSTIMGVTGNVFTDGVIAAVCAAAPVICIFWMAVLIAPRMIHFEGSLTMGDMMGTLYGKQGQVATGVFGFLFTVCAVSAQILALAYVYEFLLGFKSHWAVGLGGLIAVIYASLGGMKAVTITDVLQFVVLVIVIPMIAHVMTNEVGGIKELLNRIPAEKLQVAGHAKIGYYTSLALFLGVLSPVMLSPPIVARMLMARDKKQVAHMLFVGGGFLLFFIFLIMLIGLAAFVLYPTLAPDKIIPHVVSELFPVGLRGFCAAGIIAVIMSTADSFLHAAGLSVVHDVIRPLRTSEFQELRWVKYCTFGVGCASISLALMKTSIFGLAIYGMGIMGATITVPFVAGVLGLKPDPRSFRTALWVTIPTFIATNVLFGPAIHHWAYPISLIVNVLVFLGTHYVQNRGFFLVKRETVNSTSFVWRPTWSGFLQWLPTPRKLVAYSSCKLSRYGYNSTLFALFLSFNYMVPFFMYSYSNPAVYGWVLAIKSISIFLCLGLLLKPYWPKWLLSYFPTYYHLSLLYCLPFTASFIFFLEGSSIECLINITLAILLLITLVDWVTFVLLTLLGAVLGMVVYSMLLGNPIVAPDSDTMYALVYTLTFSTLVALIFSRRKEQHLEAKLREISDHYHTMGQAVTCTHPATIRIATMIDHQVQESIARYSLSFAPTDDVQRPDTSHAATDCLHYFFPTALSVIQQGHHLTEQLVEEIKESYIAPQRSLHSLRSCVRAILEAYSRRHPQSMHVDLTEDYKIHISFNHLHYTLIHVLSFLQAHHLGDAVCLWTTREQGLHVRLPGQALSPTSLHKLCTLFPPQDMAKHPGLAISKLLIEAQGGRLLYATSTLPQASYTEFIIALPAAEEQPGASQETV